jgi:hypothetical protein
MTCFIIIARVCVRVYKRAMILDFSKKSFIGNAYLRFVLLTRRRSSSSSSSDPMLLH